MAGAQPPASAPSVRVTQRFAGSRAKRELQLEAGQRVWLLRRCKEAREGFWFGCDERGTRGLLPDWCVDASGVRDEDLRRATIEDLKKQSALRVAKRRRAGQKTSAEKEQNVRREPWEPVRMQVGTLFVSPGVASRGVLSGVGMHASCGEPSAALVAHKDKRGWFVLHPDETLLAALDAQGALVTATFTDAISGVPRSLTMHAAAFYDAPKQPLAFAELGDAALWFKPRCTVASPGRPLPPPVAMREQPGGELSVGVVRCTGIRSLVAKGRIVMRVSGILGGLLAQGQTNVAVASKGGALEFGASFEVRDIDAANLACGVMRLELRDALRELAGEADLPLYLLAKHCRAANRRARNRSGVEPVARLSVPVCKRTRFGSAHVCVLELDVRLRELEPRPRSPLSASISGSPRTPAALVPAPTPTVDALLPPPRKPTSAASHEDSEAGAGQGDALSAAECLRGLLATRDIVTPPGPGGNEEVDKAAEHQLAKNLIEGLLSDRGGSKQLFGVDGANVQVAPEYETDNSSEADMDDDGGSFFSTDNSSEAAEDDDEAEVENKASAKPPRADVEDLGAVEPPPAVRPSPVRRPSGPSTPPTPELLQAVMTAPADPSGDFPSPAIASDALVRPATAGAAKRDFFGDEPSRPGTAGDSQRSPHSPLDAACEAHARGRPTTAPHTKDPHCVYCMVESSSSSARSVPESLAETQSPGWSDAGSDVPREAASAAEESRSICQQQRLEALRLSLAGCLSLNREDLWRAVADAGLWDLVSDRLGNLPPNRAIMLPLLDEEALDATLSLGAPRVALRRLRRGLLGLLNVSKIEKAYENWHVSLMELLEELPGAQARSEAEQRRAKGSTFLRPLPQWSCADVRRFVDAVGADTDAFEKLGIDGPALVELYQQGCAEMEEALQSLGVSQGLVQQRLRFQIALLILRSGSDALCEQMTAPRPEQTLEDEAWWAGSAFGVRARKALSVWTVEDVCRFGTALHLAPDVVEAFRTLAVDGQALLQLGAEEMRGELGMLEHEVQALLASVVLLRRPPEIDFGTCAYLQLRICNENGGVWHNARSGLLNLSPDSVHTVVLRPRGALLVAVGTAQNLARRHHATPAVRVWYRLLEYSPSTPDKQAAKPLWKPHGRVRSPASSRNSGELVSDGNKLPGCESFSDAGSISVAAALRERLSGEGVYKVTRWDPLCPLTQSTAGVVNAWRYLSTTSVARGAQDEFCRLRVCFDTAELDRSAPDSYFRILFAVQVGYSGSVEHPAFEVCKVPRDDGAESGARRLASNLFTLSPPFSVRRTTSAKRPKKSKKKKKAWRPRKPTSGAMPRPAGLSGRAMSDAPKPSGNMAARPKRPAAPQRSKTQVETGIGTASPGRQRGQTTRPSSPPRRYLYSHEYQREQMQALEETKKRVDEKLKDLEREEINKRNEERKAANPRQPAELTDEAIREEARRKLHELQKRFERPAQAVAPPPQSPEASPGSQSAGSWLSLIEYVDEDHDASQKPTWTWADDILGVGESPRDQLEKQLQEGTAGLQGGLPVELNDDARSPPEEAEQLRSLWADRVKTRFLDKEPVPAAPTTTFQAERTFKVARLAVCRVGAPVALGMLGALDSQRSGWLDQDLFLQFLGEIQGLEQPQDVLDNLASLAAQQREHTRPLVTTMPGGRTHIRYERLVHEWTMEDGPYVAALAKRLWARAEARGFELLYFIESSGAIRLDILQELDPDVTEQDVALLLGHKDESAYLESHLVRCRPDKLWEAVLSALRERQQAALQAFALHDPESTEVISVEDFARAMYSVLGARFSDNELRMFSEKTGDHPGKVAYQALFEYPDDARLFDPQALLAHLAAIDSDCSGHVSEPDMYQSLRAVLIPEVEGQEALAKARELAQDFGKRKLHFCKWIESTFRIQHDLVVQAELDRLGGWFVVLGAERWAQVLQTLLGPAGRKSDGGSGGAALTSRDRLQDALAKLGFRTPYLFDVSLRARAEKSGHVDVEQLLGEALGGAGASADADAARTALRTKILERLVRDAGGVAHVLKELDIADPQGEGVASCDALAAALRCDRGELTRALPTVIPGGESHYEYEKLLGDVASATGEADKLSRCFVHHKVRRACKRARLKSEEATLYDALLRYDEDRSGFVTLHELSWELRSAHIYLPCEGPEADYLVTTFGRVQRDAAVIDYESLILRVSLEDALSYDKRERANLAFVLHYFRRQLAFRPAFLGMLHVFDEAWADLDDPVAAGTCSSHAFRKVLSAVFGAATPLASAEQKTTAAIATAAELFASRDAPAKVDYERFALAVGAPADHEAVSAGAQPAAASESDQLRHQITQAIRVSSKAKVDLNDLFRDADGDLDGGISVRNVNRALSQVGCNALPPAAFEMLDCFRPETDRQVVEYELLVERAEALHRKLPPGLSTRRLQSVLRRISRKTMREHGFSSPKHAFLYLLKQAGKVKSLDEWDLFYLLRSFGVRVQAIEELVHALRRLLQRRPSDGPIELDLMGWMRHAQQG